MSAMGERQYREYGSSRDDWQYQDGAWREMRDPTVGGIDVVDGGARKVGFGEHANKTYEEVLTKKTQCAVYLTTADQRNRYEAKKFANSANLRKSENS